MARPNNIEAIREKMKGRPAPNAKPVVCIELGEVFPSAYQAGIKVGVDPATIRAVCKGRGKTAGGLHWRYKINDDNQN